MKKLFVMLMVLAIAGVQSFAAPEGLTEKVTRQTTAAQSKVQKQQAMILNRMESFRTWVGEQDLSNSYILQGVMGIMDSYLALADESESAAVALNGELNKPVEKKGGYKFTLRGFVIDHGCEILSDQDNFDRFVELLDKKPVRASVDVHADKTADATPKFLKGEYEAAVRQEAAKTFKVYFEENPEGVVQESAYQPLAELLTAAIGLNRMIARTPNVDDRENYAIQWFFSQDIPGKYADLKAINPELAAATNELMKSFMHTVSNGTFYGGPDHPDMKAMRAFSQDIGFRY